MVYLNIVSDPVHRVLPSCSGAALKVSLDPVDVLYKKYRVFQVEVKNEENVNQGKPLSFPPESPPWKTH